MKEQMVTVSIRDIRRLMSQNFLMINKTLLNNLGFNAACWVADMLYKAEYFEDRGLIDERGFFFNLKGDIEESTHLSPYQQTEVVQLLKELDLIEVEQRGLPRRNYYKFKIENLVSYYSKNLTSKDQKISQVKAEKFDVNNKSKDNKNKLNNTCSKEQVKHFDSQSDVSVSNSSLIRKGMAKPKAKEIPIDKPMNGPYKKIFNYWQLSGLPSPKTNTKIYEKNVVALRRLFKSFSIDQIIQTIDRLKLAISPDYSPASLKSKEYYSKLYFSEFVLNERTGESIFNKLQETPPVPLKNSVAPVPDPDPNITTYIKTFYLEKILGNANVQLTVSDENVFRITTQKLIKFHTDNQGKYPTPWFGVGDVARLYTDAITDYLDRFKNGNVRQWGINSFKWDDFFNKHLPAYMFDQAMLVKPSFKSPLNM